jgi:uncharacterized protein DUF1629
MSAFENDLALWIDDQISYLPDAVNLAYLEYNISNDLEFSCSFLGYEFTDNTSFDPEDANHLDALSGKYEWESGANMFEVQLGKNELEADSGGFDEMEVLEKSLSRSKKLSKQIKKNGLTIVYGPHDASPRLFNLQSKSYVGKSRRESDKIYYYEIHFDCFGIPFIDAYDLQGIDEEQLFAFDKIEHYADDYRIKLVLWKYAKPRDLLWFYRGWLICSQRLVDAFKEYTSSLQVFPATLQRPLDGGIDLIGGYSVINLYEKIDCIDAKWLVKTHRLTGEQTFDPGKGYKVLHEKVAGKDVFRLNVYPHRLLVSQRFRDEIESRKISGVSWLKREAE